MSDAKMEAKEEKASAIGTFFDELRRSSLLIPILAIVSGLLMGGLIVAVSSESFYTVWPDSPLQAIGNGLKAAWESYVTLFTGAFGTPSKIAAALESGDDLAIRRAFNPFFESLVKSIPYMFAGLAVALGFRAGVFNIGVEGQIFMGGIFSVWVGYTFKGLPPIIHIPFAFLAGALGGALWGFIPGLLKAKTGGHEVINTIMMNYIAYRVTDWLLREPMKRPGSTNPISPIIETAPNCRNSSRIRSALSGVLHRPGGGGAGVLVPVKTKWGFDLRTVGANPRCRYAGMNIVTGTILAMSLSVRWPGWPDQRALGREPQPVAVLLAGLWVRQHCTGAARPDAPRRRNPLGAALRLPAQRCRPDAGRGGHPHRHHLDHAGLHPGLHRRAAIVTIYRLKEPKRAEAEIHVRGRGELS
jgi:simple sugar transport system permease protein